MIQNLNGIHFFVHVVGSKLFAILNLTQILSLFFVYIYKLQEALI